MEIKTRKFIKFLGSGRIFIFTLLIFSAEAGWQALISRFPMTYDEAYHFGLIRFFSHHLNPIITTQAADTYRFGNIIQNPSFLYHYLLSFPYRLITLFTNNPEIQVIALRFINIAIAIAGLLIVRKLLRLINVSDALANLVLLALALTPLLTVLSAQINYDNLLIPAVAACTYETILLIRQLDKGVFDSKRFLILLSLCWFSSLVKFAFLPIFAAIAALVIWKTVARWHSDTAGLMAEAKKSFASIGRYMKLLLLTASLLGGFLFIRIYGVNLVRYHSPEPQCNQVLDVQDCQHYYAWNDDYSIQAYSKAHHVARLNILQYDAWWLTINIFEPFSALVPFQGFIYAFPAYLVIIGLLGTIALAYTAINFKKILRNHDLLVLTVISAVYILCLWARNYHDYLQIGQLVAIHGRYLLPVLAYLYVLLASGLRFGLEGKKHRRPAPMIKAMLALIVVVSFIYYGGFREYVHYVYPVYGRINPSEQFTLQDVAPAKN